MDTDVMKLIESQHEVFIYKLHCNFRLKNFSAEVNIFIELNSISLGESGWKFIKCVPS